MGRQRDVLFWAFAVVLIAAALPLQSQDRPGKNDILLKATFRDAPEDMIRSDGNGTYVNGRDLYVYIHEDGTLHFWVGPQSGRRAIFEFPRGNRVRPPYDPQNPAAFDSGLLCLPRDESPNPPDTLDLEPMLDLKFHTWIGTQFGTPQYNLLSMIPDQVERIRFWLHFCTRERGDFWVAENERICDQADYTSKVGWVWFKAVNMDADPSTVERWELTPWNPDDANDPLSKGFANLWRYAGTVKGRSVKTDFGDFQVPFVLYLDRNK